MLEEIMSTVEDGSDRNRGSIAGVAAPPDRPSADRSSSARPPGPVIQRRQHLTAEATGYIRDLIVSGRARAGTRIRPDEIAERLDTSVTPVREALQALRSEGFVKLEPRRGFVVVEITPQDIADVFLVQAQVAGELAARAAARISPEGLAELDLLQARLIDLSDGPTAAALEELNFRFHQVINHAADSPKLALFLRVAVHYAPRYFYGSIPGWPDATIRDHQLILAALQERRPDAVREAMTTHIGNAADLLIEHVEQLGAAMETDDEAPA